jgi:hypothetical protein
MLKCLILLTKRELNIQTPYKTSLFIIAVKTPFLSSLLISLYYKFINRASYIRTNISIDRSCFISVFAKVR